MSQPNDFLQALGRTPSGLFIVTTAFGNERAAFLGSFVQQASFVPVIFSVAVHPERYPYQLIKKSKRFALNLIGEHDHILVKTFVKGHGPEEDLISSVSHETVDGLPLLKDAIGAATFDVVNEIKPGDHTIFFGQAVDGRLYSEEGKPKVHIRKSAAHY